ncbi:putative baseplate assembly protein [Streptomyces sp. HU2014]|uniref:putative baseplate assembly protein n=1 Tax=Streptomyces sp. HU2014 TaxID=2939414 RepID=UPI00200CB4AF|nr:putative baseplate assembly protein [Streptomyces sp. HU2014]UQI46367.1 putative baseplate assembly protein [Streptomyces sp. HU2014]
MSGRCDCGCRGTATATPTEVTNPPGLTAVRHRVGTYGEFLSSMLARLSGPAYPALRDLTVRTPDDPAIALLDTWAVLGDLLTFYSERIANEGYLRTATEDGSLALLGRLVGHRPRPGVAADTVLAYTLDRDPDPGRETPVLIPRGARSQSVPGPGEEPQSFETAEELTARWSWNELPVLRRRPYQVTPDLLARRTELFLAGTANNVKPGDQLLFVFSAEESARDKRFLRTVPHVRLDRENDITEIGLPVTARPSLKGLREELTKWLPPQDKDLPTTRPRGSRLVDRFDEDVLGPLRKDLADLKTASAFADRLTTDKRRVAEALELAAPYPRIVPWFDALAGKFTELITHARTLEPPQPAADKPKPPSSPGGAHEPLFDGLRLGDDPTKEHGGHEDAPAPTAPAGPAHPAFRGLGALLPALRTAPARPPVNARHLARDPERVYAPGSDIGAQLLAALDARIREGLHDAWRKVDLTAPLALATVQVMRATATPFGATAPMPVKPGGGIDYDDWPLSGVAGISTTVTYDSAATVPAHIAFAYAVANSTTSTKDLQLPVDKALPPKDVEGVGPGTARVHTTFPPREPDPGSGGTGDAGAAAPADPPDPQKFGVTAQLLEKLPKATVFVSRPGKDQRVRVTVTNGTDPDVSFLLGPTDSPPKQTLGRLDVTAKRSALEGKPATVEVVITTQLEVTDRNRLALDAVYDGIAPGSWVAVERPRKGSPGQIPGSKEFAHVVTRVTDARVVSRAAFGITGKVTELTLQDDWLDEFDTSLAHIRDTTVLARGDTLRLAEETVTEDVQGNEIELAGLHEGLAPGRWLVFSGERTDIPGTTGVIGTELAMVAEVRQGVTPALPGDTVHTTLVLTAKLAFHYRRDTLRVHGNVARATHGATRDEPIGSGDASRANQTFTLWQSPLTWLAADNALGAESTLEVRVDGVRWREVDSLAGRGPRERVFVTHTADGPGGRTTLTFGDGVHGARLPTGQENVRARYRIGVGRAANVKAGRITQPTTRPLGVTGVVNPLPATGGADPDGPRLARRNIPLAVTALDRLVSVPDYEDFARSRAGIGRASARQIFDGTRRTVHLTVAGVDDIALTDDSDIVRTLRTALAAHGDPRVPVTVAVRELVLLIVAADVKVHPDHSWDLVEPALRRALLARLGYPARELGTPAYLSEVLATAQSVPGVEYVDVDVFTGVPGSLTPQGLERLPEQLTRPQPVVGARPATYEEARYTVSPPGQETTETLTEVAARNGITVAGLLRLNPDITDTRPLRKGRVVVVFRGIRPAQFALLSPDVPDTLILKEARA